MTDASDPAPLHQAMLDWWRTLVLGESARCAGDAAWTLADVVDRSLLAQSTVSRLVGLSLDWWRELLAPPGSDGESRRRLDEYGEELRRELLNAAEAFGAPADVTRLWSLYAEHLHTLGQPFQHLLRELQTFPTSSPGEGSDLAGVMALFSDAYGQTFERGLRSPGLGPTREFHEKLMRGFEAWVIWARAAAEYQAIVADLWVKTFQRVTERLVEAAGNEQAPLSMRRLTELFLETAEDVFADQFGSEEYVTAQARAGNAGMRYLAREREIVDVLLKIGHLPSRTEVDEAHRQIYELRKELRKLRAELRELRRAVQAGDREKAGRR